MTYDLSLLHTIATRSAIAVSVLLWSACTDDEVAGDGDDEVGDGDVDNDSELTDPIDPLGGSGRAPTQPPDPNATWAAPSSLGNGLVHDSRYDLQAEPSTRAFSAAELAAGVDWAEFVDSHQAKLRVGFRPSQVHAELELHSADSKPYALTLTDRSVYISDDDASFRSQTKTYLFASLEAEQSLTASGPSGPGEPRPTSIDTFSLGNGPSKPGATVVWTYDRKPDNPVDWQLVVGMPYDAFTSELASLTSAGYRPISISSRLRNGASEYAAIFIKDGVASTDWRTMLATPAATLDTEIVTAWEAGYAPFRTTLEQGSEAAPLYNSLWYRRSPNINVEIRSNMSALSLDLEDIAWRQLGYHLESATPYKDGTKVRHRAVWARYDPYLRWQGTEFAEDDATYLSRYEPFHLRAIQSMTLAGEGREGDFYRPSVTLHIFENNLATPVLNRAYTYGPAIYPDTPIDAAMILASVSKAITAAAVVREMDVQGLPLTTPFAEAAGIDNVPSMAAVPSVLDVLRMLGGFQAGATSYTDHSLIDASIYGQYPISGTMMYDYVVAGGHLGGGAADDYWDPIQYSDTQMTGALLYSNPGYSMLGEVVRLQSGISYQDYVRDHLLAPLNVVDKVFPDAGHRNAADQPTMAGLRSYLTNDGHPYSANCNCTYAAVPPTESESVPSPLGSDQSPAWTENVGPLSASAPVTAAKWRYAGSMFMGGAPLAAGGWHADGKSLGWLTMAIAQGNGYLLPESVAAQLWSPQWWNQNHSIAPGWSYGLGWYARGNWVAMAGGTDGGMAVVIHNLAYNFTVVYLSNQTGNPFQEFTNPLLRSNSGWSQEDQPGKSIVGGEFPCKDDWLTPINECSIPAAAY